MLQMEMPGNQLRFIILRFAQNDKDERALLPLTWLYHRRVRRRPCKEKLLQFICEINHIMGDFGLW